jgi:hypothetical protein
MNNTAVAERKTSQLPETVVPATTIMEVIARAAVDPNADVEKLERLMAMAERVRAKDAEQAFNAAMTDAQSGMSRISADGNNPSTKSKYATYAALDRVVRPIYTSHGFALSFDTGPDAPADHVRVLCHVSHREGHSRTYRIDMPADGKGAKGGDVMTKTHAVGAAMSYGSRYLLKLIFNVAVGEDDNDGNGASGETITTEQLAKLQEMMEQANADPEKFTKFMKVSALCDIRAKDFGNALEALNHAISERQRKAKAQS